jgi:hypothetical protein
MKERNKTINTGHRQTKAFKTRWYIKYPHHSQPETTTIGKRTAKVHGH